MKNPHRTGQGAARAQADITIKPITAQTPARQPTIHARPVAGTPAPLAFGPWSRGIDPIERDAQLRCLAGLAAAFVGSAHPLVAALRTTERDAEAAARALQMPDALPSLTRRRLLTTFGAVTRPKSRQPR
jgi:hypothetical protein